LESQLLVGFFWTGNAKVEIALCSLENIPLRTVLPFQFCLKLR
jgi:hypothetical protein